MRTPCERCGRSMFVCACQSGVMKRAGCDTLVKLLPYEKDSGYGVVRRVVLDMKRNERQALLDKCAEELAPGVRDAMRCFECDTEDVVVTYVPRSKKAIRKDGVDQAKLLASALAAKLGLSCRPLVRRVRRVKTQKRLSAKERYANLRGAFSAVDVPHGCTVLLVDDIVTTGASLAAVCAVLRRAGADHVIAVALAQTQGKGD